MTCPQARPKRLKISIRADGSVYTEGPDAQGRVRREGAAAGDHGQGTPADARAFHHGKQGEKTMDYKHGNAKDGAERARRALDGLKHCMPEGKDGGGCGGCPYMEKNGCACEDREMVYLPMAMVEDFRNVVAMYAAMNGEDDGNG